MTTANPYAAPTTNVLGPSNEVAARDPGAQYRSGDVLVQRHGVEFADRCVKCNQPITHKKLKRVLYWHHPALYLLVIPGLLIYALVAIVVRKKAIVQVGLCGAHQRRRRWAIGIGWLGFLAAIGSCTGASFGEIPVLFLVAIVLLFGSLVYGMVGARVVTPVKIDEFYVRMKGVCRAYLAELPLWTGR